MSVASGSVALAVIPTTVPIAAFSVTASAATLPSTGAVTSNSSTSPMAMLKLWLELEPSALVARTVMSVVAPTTSRSIVDATVTTPLTASIAYRPPGLLDRL